MNNLILTTLLVVGAIAAGHASAMTDAEYDTAVAEINSRYQSSYDEAEREGEDIKNESSTCLFEGAWDSDWEITKVSFDVPEVTFKSREFSFHTVKTTFKSKVIAKTKVPKTYFENKKICCGISTKIPVVRMEVKEIKTRVPEFKWDKTSFSTKIPEFSSKRIEWKFHILKLKKVRELNIPCKEEKDRAESLSNRVTESSEKHKAEINELTGRMISARADELAGQMAVAEKEFERGLDSMDQSIAETKANGIDPAAVVVDYEGQQTTLVGARAMLLEQKTSALESMRAAHRQMLESLASLEKA